MFNKQGYLSTLDDEFTIADVGSTLLEDLAKGLYQPDEVIREYVQNAVDAHRQYRSEVGEDPDQPISIEVHGNQISVYDFGIGMDEEDVKKVKAVAVSRKKASDIRLTGHKGVGVWAGLSFFRTMTLYTTKCGSELGYKLIVHFRKIVESLSPEAHIGDVLNPNYQIEVYRANPDDHFTVVTLEEPSLSRSPDRFLDPEQVSDAVRRICPCEIDDTFGYYDRVMNFYREHGFRVYPIAVNHERVYKSFPSVVEGFQSDVITIDDQRVAVYWTAVHKKSTKLKSAPNQLVGIRLVESGFALGGANPYSDPDLPPYAPLSRNNYVNWHIGEIHLTSPNLRPNLKRKELEESEDARQFIIRLRELYRSIEYNDRVLSKTRELLEKYGPIETKATDFDSRPTLALTLDEQFWLVNTSRQIEEQETQSRSKQKNETTDALRSPDVRDARRRMRNAIEHLRKRHMRETEGQVRDREATGAANSSSVNNTASTSDTGSASATSQALPASVSDTPTGERPPMPSASPVSAAPQRLVEPSLTTQLDLGLAPGYRDTELETEENQNNSGEQSEDDNGEFEPLVEVLLTITEQVLEEDLNRQPDIKQAIMSKLRARLHWVIQHA